jgi:hypothetical protein
LKAKTDILDYNMQLGLKESDTAIYTGMETAARTKIIQEINSKINNI